MALNPADLASLMAKNMGYPHVTKELLGLATGIIGEVKVGTATFGNIPTPHPISGIVGPAMAALCHPAMGYPFPSVPLIKMCTAISDHIVKNGYVTYASPVPAPPAILPPAAWFQQGTISGLEEGDMADEIASAMGYNYTTKEVKGLASAICSHIMDNAQVESGIIS